MTLQQTELNFDGSDYNHDDDSARLSGQIRDIFMHMKDGRWRTLNEIEGALRYPQASISAQLRNLRKSRFGGHVIDKRRRGDRKGGLFEYSLEVKGV